LESDVKSPFAPETVVAIRTKLATRATLQDQLLFSLAIDSMLRAGDIVQLTVSDVCDRRSRALENPVIRQSKTSRPVILDLSGATRQLIERHVQAEGLKGDDLLFSAKDRAAQARQAQSGMPMPLSVRTVERKVKAWADLGGLVDVSDFSAHSLRKTRAAHVYAQTKDIATVSRLLGHMNTQHTDRYLGISSQAAVEVAKGYRI
jgi:integrase